MAQIAERKPAHGDYCTADLTFAESKLLARLASSLPSRARTAVRRRLTRLNRPRWGNLRRREPFSGYYGFDRGTPVDRFYIERFLAKHARDIRGTVLEVGSARYARAFREPPPDRVEIVDIDAGNPETSIVADLSEPSSLPPGRFDCFILIQTLQLVADLDAALANAWQSLASGGVLLVSVPGITRSDPDHVKADRWRFTPAGLDTLLAGTCSKGVREVTGYGNLTSAMAFLLGLAAEELEESELTAMDPHFTVSVCARVEKR
jgi:SAM-dependent methyltransferase